MKRFIILFASVATLFTATAQNYERYYNRPFAHLGLTLGGGLNAMLYNNVANSKTTPGLCLDLGVRYTHFFSPVGISLGIHLSSVGAGIIYNNQEVTTNLTHANNPYARYDLTTDFDNWHEHQSITVLGVPLEALYRIRIGGGKHVFCGLGMQLDIPTRGSYSSTEGSFTTTGHFHVGGPHSVNDMPEHGFSTYSETFDAQISDFKIGVSALADIGLHIPLGFSGGLYFGIFATYGISSILDKTEGGGPLVSINSSDPSIIDYRGTFAVNDINYLRLLRIGIKVGIDLGSPMDN